MRIKKVATKSNQIGLRGVLGGMGQGECEQFAAFVQERGDHFLRLAIALTGDRAAGEALFESALEQMVRRLRRIDVGHDMEGYLRSALINGAIEHSGLRHRALEASDTTTAERVDPDLASRLLRKQRRSVRVQRGGLTVAALALVVGVGVGLDNVDVSNHRVTVPPATPSSAPQQPR